MSSESSKVSLHDFISSSGITCWVCNLPAELRAEIEAGWNAGIRLAAMSKWLHAIHQIDIPTHEGKRRTLVLHMETHIGKK